MSTDRPGAASDHVWGHSVWSWRLQAVFAAACLVLLVSSQTSSGQIFAVMLLIAQAGGSWILRLVRARAKADAELDEQDGGALPPN